MIIGDKGQFCNWDLFCTHAQWSKQPMCRIPIQSYPHYIGPLGPDPDFFILKVKDGNCMI